MQKPGFTLIEMLATITFVIVLASMVAMFGISALKMQEVDRTLQTIRNALVASRDQAISERESSRWGVEFATSSIMAFKGSTYATRDHAFDLFNPFAPAIKISGISEIVFVPPFGNAATSGSVTITDGDRTVSISVNAYGMIQAQ
jgi:hypothetical protein